MEAEVETYATLAECPGQIVECFFVDLRFYNANMQEKGGEENHPRIAARFNVHP